MILEANLVNLRNISPRVTEYKVNLEYLFTAKFTRNINNQSLDKKLYFSCPCRLKSYISVSFHFAITRP